MLFFSLVIFFSVYSFLGWVLETIYCSIFQKRLIIRGFLVGPYCPIYGFGSLIALVLLSPFKTYPILVFFLAVVISSTLEYVASFLLEKIFKKSWWDYSNRPLNLNGRINLIYSLIWGALCMILLYVLHPFLIERAADIAEQVIWIAAVVLIFIFVFDLAYSVRDTIRFNKEIIKLTHLTEKIEHLRTLIMTSAGEKRMLAEKELSQLLSQHEAYALRAFKKIRRILNAFPTIRFKQKDLRSIREILNGYFNRK